MSTNPVRLEWTERDEREFQNEKRQIELERENALKQFLFRRESDVETETEIYEMWRQQNSFRSWPMFEPNGDRVDEI